MRILWQLELTMCAKAVTVLFSYRHTWQPKNQLRPNLLRDLLVFAENERIPTIVGTDANAHHTIWGSSNINPRGEDLLAYCVSADLNFCNVDNKQTFRTKTREEVLNLTLVNRCAWDRVVGWHVSDVPLISDQCISGSRLKAES